MKNEFKTQLCNITGAQFLTSFLAHKKYSSTPEHYSSNLDFTDDTKSIFGFWQKTEEQVYSQIFMATQPFLKPLNLTWGTCISKCFSPSKDSASAHSLYHMTLS